MGEVTDFKPVSLIENFNPVSEAAQPKEGKSVGGFLGNIGSDVTGMVKGVANAIAHPVDTATGLRDYVAGAGGELRKLTGMQPNPYMNEEERKKAALTFEPTKEAIKKSIDNPKGIPGRVLDYAYEKPVSTALIASQGLSGVSKAAEAGGLAKTARVADMAATYTNPASLAKLGTTGTAGKIAKETIGTMTGGGPGFVEEAVKGTEGFKKAMRGQITGEEIVDNAKGALGSIRDARGKAYEQRLTTIQSDPTKMLKIASDLQDDTRNIITHKGYDIRPEWNTETGKLEFNFDNSPLVEQQGVIRKALDDVYGWQDNTAAGLDILKKRLSTYIDQTPQGSPSRSLLTKVEKGLDAGLKRDVPGYVEMTKGYSEATKLIKDIESNLMLRKEGMSGRITADNTLRRLSSALRENFEMRKDLLETLGSESGADIAGQVAGYVGSQWIPRGGIAKLGVGGSLYYLHLFNPKLWPVLAASSPRVMGEFLNAFGKAAKSTPVQKAAEAAQGSPGRMTGIMAGQINDKTQKPKYIGEE